MKKFVVHVWGNSKVARDQVFYAGDKRAAAKIARNYVMTISRLTGIYLSSIKWNTEEIEEDK